MQDDQLLQDLERSRPYAESTIDKLRQHGITTYSQLFALLRDRGANSKLLRTACGAMLHLHKIVDKRRAVPPLLVSLQSTDAQVQWAAANTLGMLNSRRAVMPLIELLSNKNQLAWVRAHFVDSLCLINDPRVAEFLRPIMFDQTEEVAVRSEAIEWLRLYEQDERLLLQDWIALLDDPASNIRFWAAYRLSQYFGNLTPALAELDRIVAFDHSVPRYWGWHVDREAIYALEKAYMHLWMGYPEDDADFCLPYRPWLISPAPEYQTYIDQHRKWEENRTYTTISQPPAVTLDIDPAWLAGKIREQWPDVQINTREPRPQAYVLDWHIAIEGKILSGALHRDRYAVILTGDEEAVMSFSAWYRCVIPPEQPLFLYEWADQGKELLS